ncbi:hypothetical protein ACGFI9_10930 [Micromonospora sp. NPDC048930]|uniref:hypothetical protein n=1 Tax=Micromonospora sp. NPDC048930 TaxID=3364261 RepID=UPI003717060D
MATVRVRFRGGPYDGVAVDWEVPDADDPPTSYPLKLHGAHEATGAVEYRRLERAPQGAAESWIYAAPEGAAG